MLSTNVGHVTDLDGIEIEVWLCEGHVFLHYGASQVGDFPLGEPPPDELALLANRVAEGEAKHLACIGQDEVIDRNERFSEGMAALCNKQIHP